MANIISNLDWTILVDKLLLIIPALICIVLHEMSHGFAAYLLGDTTAKDAGRLTFNPVRHIDIMGLLMMVVCGFGWAKPVPVNMFRFKSPRKGMAITAAAGPVCNFVLCALFLFIYGFAFFFLSGKGTYFSAIILALLLRTAMMNLSLGLFNLIPISPLDGSKVLYSFLPDKAYYTLMRYERYGMIVLIVCSLLNVFDNPLSKLIGLSLDKLLIIAQAGCDLASKLF